MAIDKKSHVSSSSIGYRLSISIDLLININFDGLLLIIDFIDWVSHTIGTGSHLHDHTLVPSCKA